MDKIPVANILRDFNVMLKEHWKYGADTKTGTVDCSGAFVWSYQNNGHNIYHGSNRIAREEVEKIYPIGSVKIVPGMAAFKHKNQTDNGYALPSVYKSGGSHYNGDLNDYYHIGLIDNDTSQVLNAQSTATGFVSSDIRNGWSHVGYLKQVDYGDNKQIGLDKTLVDNDEDASPSSGVITAIVTAESGSTVKMRATASTTERMWWPVPIGSDVLVTGAEKGGWTPIAWGGHRGYMMSVFLTKQKNEETKEIKEDEFDSGTLCAVEIYDLTKEQADDLKKTYPSARIFETVG